ncbi:MAG: YraN family protein [Cyanobacteria bacterium SIG28]|nr:YraN family protein [Cyanobacteria bacterium SIG28]
MNNIKIGKNGEEIAKEFLIKNGYKILETNKRFSRFCEIDIIALDKDTVVFCEVKTRKTNICGSPFEAITKSKYAHIKKGVYLYLQENPKYKKFRIDAVAIVLQPKLEVKHLKNISL